MKGEIFIADDPCWLSGGAKRCTYIDYGRDLAPMHDVAEQVTTEYLLGRNPGLTSVESELKQLGQCVHSGRGSYHQRPDGLNLFVDQSDSEWPTIGVELETIRRDNQASGRSAMLAATHSNWFHFEDDGSLRSTGDGYECITEPLGRRHYRDLRLWVGLQNLLVPWVYSWNTPATGLHVHVGLARFAKLDAKSAPDFVRHDPVPYAVRYLARHMLCYLQTAIADETLLTEVFLRPRSGYCERRGDQSVANLPLGRMTARDIVAVVLLAYGMDVREAVGRMVSLRDNLGNSDPISCVRTSNPFVVAQPYYASGHHVEYNTDHFATFEFRRGKGTLNGVSIHRMVEYAALSGKYVERMLTEPDMVPSNRDFRTFLAENTTSAALRETATKGL